jgi:hypothetical protein
MGSANLREQSRAVPVLDLGFEFELIEELR